MQCITEEELYKKIRKYDRILDWTFIESDESLKIYCKHFLKDSNKMEKYAKENNFICIDTSKNRDKVLDDAFNMIKENVEK